jgi:hypothetical protein
VFNNTVRDRVYDFETHALQQLNARVGLSNIWAFRVDAGSGGEALYPESNDGKGHTNSYWAFDANAQGTGDDLPSGVDSTPFPGWHPGATTYNGQPFTTAQVRQWYDWYFNARMNFYNWQVSLFRTVGGFNNYLEILTPGYGTRPGEYTTSINNFLNGTGDPNGTMSRAAVWQGLYPALTNKIKIIAYISSLGDGSGLPSSNLCQPSDMSVNSNADRTVDTWGGARYISYIASKYGLVKAGENPGWGAGRETDYGMPMMERAAKEMASCGLIGMFWAHDDRLYTTTGTPKANVITLADYARMIARYNNRRPTVRP